MKRREFLQSGTMALGLGKPRAGKSCILLMLVGGASQVDTWDMKPDAPSGVRGPYRPIRTNVAGVEISEIFPRMARQADKYTLVRSVWHDAPAFHESGLQAMQTGGVFADGEVRPHLGSVVAARTGGAAIVLPFPLGNLGTSLLNGQPAGSRTSLRMAAAEPEHVRRRYGLNRFGQSCLEARRLVESGYRFVTVNMFETVFGELSWDIHGSAPFSPMACYRDHVGPMFDMAFSALVEDLDARGTLSNTLVVAMSEFGRTPKINPAGGRDHWPGCQTVVMAGGGMPGGCVIGSSDKLGAEPRDNPVSAAMLNEMILGRLA